MSKTSTFVLGGARSGKSAFAEALVVNTGKPKVYIATAQAFDTEMQNRIADHISRRGPDWTTIESPLDTATALRSAKPGSTILLDCATLWLSNQILAGHDIDTATNDLLAALADCRASVVIVSNEVGAGIVPDNTMARQFRDAQGTLNQKLAEFSDLAVLVVAGLPLVLKGQLP